MNTRSSPGLQFPRRFTRAGTDVLGQFTWKTFHVGLGGATRAFEAPASWSDTAVLILADKYAFKPAGDYPGETSARQIFQRIADAFHAWGRRYGYFATDADAAAFRDELLFLLADQRFAPNSPVWFNVGRHAAGQDGGPGQWRVPDEGGEAVQLRSGYEHPNMSACYILAVDDAMFGGHGIYDLMLAEARLFKFGSGSGANFSRLRSRGERLSTGGASSGVMGFLRALDASAGVIKSGGTTRRSAKMVILEADHPEVEDFVMWKAREEGKAKALMAAGYSGGMEGEAYTTVSGQNSNNSVMVTDAFLHAVERDEPWNLLRRTDWQVARTVRARDLWRKVLQAAWECGDPGLQFWNAIQQWHTCKADGAIRGCNPCSEYIFLDDTSCNLGSLNVLRYLGADGSFDVAAFGESVRLATAAMDIVVEAASYPTKSIAEQTRAYRTVGPGYANLGGMLMALGLAYDSPEGRAVASAVTSLLTASAYATSCELAQALGPYPRFQANRAHHLDVLALHHAAAQRLAATGSPLEALEAPACWTGLARDMAEAAHRRWKEVLESARHGVRNAQVTVLAPTGTIGLVMDCATTGVEPPYTLVSYKELAGGGKLTLTVDTVAPALARLGYTAEEAEAIQAQLTASGPDGQPRGSMAGVRGLRPEHLPVFQTSNDPEGNTLRWQAHVFMVAALQPFLSGGISKTVNLPANATVDDVGEAFLAAWRLGCKNVALYRDGSKGVQVLAAKDQAAQEPASALERLTEPEVRRLIAERFPHLERGWRRPIPYRYPAVKEFSVKVSDPLHPEGVRHFVTLKFDRDGDGRLRLYEIFWSAGQAGEVVYDMSSKLAAEWSRRVRAGEDPLVLAKENIGSAGLGGGMVAHELIKRASSGADLVWKLIALEVFGLHDFIMPELYDAYLARLDRPPFIHEELAREHPVPVRRPEADLTTFAAPAKAPASKFRAPDVTGLRCPRCGATGDRIRPTGACKTCQDCGESIGGCG